MSVHPPNGPLRGAAVVGDALTGAAVVALSHGPSAPVPMVRWPTSGAPAAATPPSKTKPVEQDAAIEAMVCGRLFEVHGCHVLQYPALSWAGAFCGFRVDQLHHHTRPRPHLPTQMQRVYGEILKGPSQQATLPPPPPTPLALDTPEAQAHLATAVDVLHRRHVEAAHRIAMDMGSRIKAVGKEDDVHEVGTFAGLHPIQRLPLVLSCLEIGSWCIVSLCADLGVVVVVAGSCVFASLCA